MKKKRRFPLALLILLPIVFAIAGALGTIYAGAYMTLRGSAFQAAANDDVQDLIQVKELYETDADASGGFRSLIAAVQPVISAYETHKPSSTPTPGSPEEAEYKNVIHTAANNMVYYYVEQRLERYVTDFIGIYYEDIDTNRLVLVMSSNPDEYNHNKVDQAARESTSAYLGSFFAKSAPFANESFEGETMPDKKLGPLFTSGLFLGEVMPSAKEDPAAKPSYRLWAIRQTMEATVYGALPIFSRNFALQALAVFIILPTLLYLLIYFLVGRKVRRLSLEGTKMVAELRDGKTGHFFFASPSHLGTEMSELNDVLFYLEGAIGTYTEAIRQSASYEEKIKADLMLAEKIQTSMVPSAPLFGEEYLLRGYMRPAKEVGGDLYNYLKIDEDHVGFFIGDVSGKGVPAALFMAKANTLFQLLLPTLDVDKANDFLSKGNDESFFVTCFMAVLNIKTGELRYVNAGHEPVFLCHNGVYSALPEEPNFMLGCLEGFQFEKQSIVLSPGDRLFLYTDGVSEAMDEDGNLFGKERILKTLNDYAGLPSAVTFEAMREAVLCFAGEAEQADDACLVALDYAKEKAMEFEIAPEGLEGIAPFVDAFLEGKPTAFISQIQVILDELCSNVVLYSNSPRPATLVLSDDGKAIHCHILDHGVAFDPLHDRQERDPEMPGGLGIEMAVSMADRIVYHRVGATNVLSILKAYR